MKQRENETAAPRGRKLVRSAACALLIASSISAGYFTAPEETQIPALITDDTVLMQPCDAIAEESIELVIAEKPAEKPKTVKTKEMIEEEQPVAYKTIEKESSELNLGEVCVAQEGSDGLRKVTKEVIIENGEIIEEEIISTEVLVESVPEITLKGTAGLAEPLTSMQMTSPYGFRWGRQHEGVDLGMPEGEPIYAAKTGTVTFASYTEGYGNLVKIDHGEGMETYYAHCSRIDVEVGQQVEAGQQIAAVGSTGNSTGPHLHFEVRIDGAAQDPARWLELE